MSATKYEGHTPGPWRTEYQRGADLMYRQNILDAENRVVATCAWCGIAARDGWTISARDANAALIADAPKLLAQRDALAEAPRTLMSRAECWVGADHIYDNYPKQFSRALSAAIHKGNAALALLDENASCPRCHRPPTNDASDAACPECAAEEAEAREER